MGPEEGDRYRTRIVIPWDQEIIAIGGTVPKAHVRLSFSAIIFLEEGFIEMDKVHGLCHLEALGAMSQINVNKLNGVDNISTKETCYFGDEGNSGLIIIEGKEMPH